VRSIEVYQKSVEESSHSRASTTEEQIRRRPRQTEALDVTPCFTATVSFKRREDPAKYAEFRYQTPQVSAGHIRKTYTRVLQSKKPDDQPTAPGADAMWWTRGVDADVWTETEQVFPGVDIRKVDMGSYNRGRGSPDRVGEWRQLSFYRLIKDDKEEHDGDDETSMLNLHACAHLYASDRNSLFLITHALGLEDQIVAMSSLSHTVIFHGDPESLRMCDKKGKPTWFLQEAWTENGGLNRGCHGSRLWSCSDDGTDEIIATTKQDGMVRVPADSISTDENLEKRKSRMENFGKGKL
jgi:Thioesterase-like superfamily